MYSELGCHTILYQMIYITAHHRKIFTLDLTWLMKTEWRLSMYYWTT